MKRQIIFFSILVFGFNFTLTAQEAIKDTTVTSDVKNEKMAEFPGGNTELMKFVNKNKQYENEKDKKKTVGSVWVSFVIETDGTISDNIEIIRSLSDFYDKEAIRIIKSMPKWSPAMQNGRPVRIKYNLVVKF
jgi:protein TonB